MTMLVREDLDPEQTRQLLSSPGVQYVRDDAKKSRRRERA